MAQASRKAVVFSGTVAESCTGLNWMKSFAVLKVRLSFLKCFSQNLSARMLTFSLCNGDKLNPARALTGGEFASGYEFAVEVVAAVNVEIVAALAGGNEPAVPGVKVEGAGHFTGGELPCAF